MTQEIWLPTIAAGYEVSSLGRVRSVDRVVIDVRGRARRLKGCVLSPGPHGDTGSYVAVNLGRSVHVAVHILVCTAFRGQKPSPQHQVAHFNNNGLDNRNENVRWATGKENMADMTRHGTRRVGSAHPRAKLSERDRAAVAQLAIARSKPMKEIGRSFGVHEQTIYKIKRKYASEQLANA